MKKFVFLGNPNVGKSALINSLSDSKIKVGNWPGVTVEKIEARKTHHNQELMFIDLPGLYDFNDKAEEKITTDYLLSGDYDCIINVVDATNMERNLYLTLLARELQKPMIVLLNFDDDVRKSGMVIDEKKLERYLQVPVFKTSAPKKEGISEVLDYLSETNFEHEKEFNIYYEESIDKIVLDIHQILINNHVEAPVYGLKFLAFRLFEKSEKYINTLDEKTKMEVEAKVNQYVPSESMSNFSNLQLRRYNQITNILSTVIDKKGASRYKVTKQLDKIVLNKWAGLPIFLFFSVYFLSLVFNVANPINDWVGGFIGDFLGYHIGSWISGWPQWSQDMIIDGILGGVGGVLEFAPLMYFIYLLMGILEESGIMSRIAFLMDRLMRSIGLNGKAFISLILGFGCTVPAITSTKTLNDEKARKATTMMLPFISCGARLPVYALFCAAFFSKSFGLVVASLYIFGIVIAILAGLVMKKFGFFKNDEDTSAFTIELPPYRFPQPKVLFKNVNNRLKGFLKRVTTIIMVVLFFIWALNYFPNGRAEDSYLTRGTEVVQPIFKPAGFGESKEAVAAIPTSLVAKEAVVGTIQGLIGIEEEEAPEGEVPEGASIVFQIKALGGAAKDALGGFIPSHVKQLFVSDIEDSGGEETVVASQKIFSGEDAPLKAYAYMVFILLMVPCAVTIATVKKEFGFKYMFQLLGVTLIVPYVVSIIVYQVGHILLY
ncbi:MAG: ferrous iron transport protein B [Erysipelotrichales bacterium]